MYKGIVFDVDDTLYDQQQPFINALEKSFPRLFPSLDIALAYTTFRQVSDQVFTKQTSGEWSLEYMRIYRIKETMSLLSDTLITTEEASHFQQTYLDELQKIVLQPSIKNLLNYLKNCRIPIGIITNGPTSHQEKKLAQLNIQRWVSPEHIIVSGSVAIEKPHKEIFQLAETALHLNHQELLYIGDSFENDVIGAHNAHWDVLWLNHRNKKNPSKSIQPTWEVSSFSDLLELLENEMTDKNI